MKCFMLLICISTASMAMADDPAHWTTQATAHAADCPVYIGQAAYEARRWTSGGWQQAGGASLYQAAWFPACGGAKTRVSSSGVAPAAANYPHFRITPAEPGRGFPSSSDYYPAASLRLGESGAVTIRACVGKDGFLTTPPTVQKSSGSPYLDAAALTLASDGTGHYRPATMNGMPVEAWAVFRVTFVLTHGPNVNRLQR
jgi:TonB family protein